ncbi:MAG: MBL fold metallo-hydrolase [Trueperaceae bacterium]
MTCYRRTLRGVPRCVIATLAALCATLMPGVALALELIFLDVEQGTAVLIRAPGGQTALYDAGPRSSDVVAQLRALGVGRLDLAVASHAHADHIGGMAEVLTELRPAFYLDNDLPHTTRTYERTLEAAIAAEVTLLAPERRRIGLGDVELQVLPPPHEPSWGQNDNSVGLRVRYGAFDALLPGDAEPRQWDWWLRHHEDLLSDLQVHLASHHGSRNGDTPSAMAVLSPEVVVIGVGRDNRYGHPHEEALALYAGSGAQILRTDLHGRVTVHIDADGSFRVATERTTAPRDAEPPPEAGAADGPAAAAGQEGPAPDCVDLNRADPNRLTEIVHIGPARARAVVDARNDAPFASLNDLTRVSGIAAGRLDDIREQGVACVRP